MAPTHPIVALFTALALGCICDDLVKAEESEVTAQEQNMCSEPPEPRNGRMTCEVPEDRQNWFVCKAVCDDGFHFPDNKKSKKRACNRKNGKWKPDSKFPDCAHVCDPPCDNKGECVKGDICICPPEYRGHRCQYELEYCNPAKRLSESVNWNCSHSSSESFCAFACPQGTESEYPPPLSYHCSLAGVWTPSIVPQCASINNLHSFTNLKLNIAKKSAGTTAVCASWNHLHYSTFDGGVYTFQSDCTYLLAKDCIDDTFAIHLTNTLDTQVVLLIGQESYNLKNGNLSFIEHNNATHIIPTSINGLLFQKIADYITVTSSLGFRLKWDGKASVLLRVNNNLKNKTCGLCGRFDDIVSNDFELPDGSITENIDYFVDSWKVEGRQCNSGSLVVSTCSIQNINRASEACGVIFNEKFSSCHHIVDPKPYYESCKMDYCSCGDAEYNCICESLSQYFFECKRLGGDVGDGWRTEKLCHVACPERMAYEDCGSICPKTCKDTVYDCEDDHCTEGCHCMLGLVLHEGQCIRKEDCPCMHKGREYEGGQIVQQDCNACQCLSGAWHCTTEECKARCSSVADPHYTTFDGKKFDFISSCPVYLVYQNNFSIVQENMPCETQSTSSIDVCTKSLTVTYYDSILILKPDEVIFNANEVSLPFSVYGISVFQSSSLFTMVNLPNNVSLSFDGKNRIYIDAPPTLLGKTKGLCGTFNHNPSDDFLTPESDVETDVEIFASRWQVSDRCHKRSRRSDRSQCEMHPQKMQEAKQLCQILKSGLFETCHGDVDPDYYFSMCIQDMCACSQELVYCLCPTLADYGSSCSKMGVVLDWVEEFPLCKPQCENGQVYHECNNPCKSSCAAMSIIENCEEDKCVQGCACPTGLTLNSDGSCVLIDHCPCVFENKEYAFETTILQGANMCKCENARWHCRSASIHEMVVVDSDLTKFNQPMKCGENQIYVSCVEQCPKTCQNVHLPRGCDTNVCFSGCSCQEGYILDTELNKCIMENECGCRHGGHRYRDGDMIRKNCNVCFCKGTRWECTEKTCPGICSIWGESHFKTFDGRMYDFQGDCEFVLVRGSTRTSSFSVTVQNVPCGSNGVTCSKSFSFQIDNHKIQLSKGEALPENTRESPIAVFESGLYVFLYTQSGVTLQWDKGTRMIVTLQPKWRNQVLGLCGNFNDNQNDDFSTSTGGLPEAQIKPFVDSWKVHESCPPSQLPIDACSVHPIRQSWAYAKCGILKSPIFSSCHTEVPVDPYFERCVFDACACDEGGDCTCLCTAIAAYSHECNIHDVHVKWRTQELCPIQCVECATYESCMSPCPLRTCISQHFMQSVDETCALDSCIEGCHPKPCPPGQIYKSIQELECIPESECAVTCIEVNGIPYYEGERIADASVADPCQSCHCTQGSITCTGKPCPITPVVTPPQQLLNMEVECKASGWSPWINSPPSPDGDFELLQSLYVAKELSEYCGLDNLTAIQCRVAGSKVSFKQTDQTVFCSLPHGLICENDKQISGSCHDYEIRLFCDCGERSVCKSGWTEYFNVDNPQNNVDQDDDETIENVRKYHSFCPNDRITDVECVTQINGDLIDYSQTGEFGLKCSQKIGFLCNSLLRQEVCRDYMIRFYCSCEEETTAIPHTTTISLCPPGEIYDLCAYMCNQTCSAFAYNLSMSNKCSDGCIEGCRPAEGCPTPMRWRDYYNCVPKRECSCVMPQNNGIAVYVASNDVIEHNCEVCQCVEDTLSCHPIPQCGETTFIYHDLISTTPIPTMPLENIETPDCWTKWINVDSPDDLGGDIEDLVSIRRKFEFCHDPVRIECRTARDKKDVLKAKQDLICDLNVGLKCWNSENGEDGCFDYEIRFFCPCAMKTSTEQPASTSVMPMMEPSPCVNGWTEWFNSHMPDTFGEYETVQSARTAGGYFCSSDMIVDIECRQVGQGHDLRGHRQHDVICNLQVGLSCRNSDRNEIDYCHDYEVRFYCHCPESSTFPTTPVTTAFPSPRIPKLSSCAHWSDWINENHPGSNSKSKKGIKGSFLSVNDVEKKSLESLQEGKGFCLEGAITEIECRDVVWDVDYRDSGDLGLKCHPETGFQCRGKDQLSGLCKDYKIRYFCQCEQTYSTVIIRPTLTTISIPSCNQYYELIDGPNPLPDSNLKASSSTNPSSGPQSSRLSSVQGKASAGAWIAETLDQNQFLEVDLNSIRPVYGVITKGRNGAQEWVLSYFVLYSRDGLSYSYVMENGSNTKKIFTGNYDSDSVVEHIFTQPFEARFVRIQPLTFMKEIALRVDFLGCAEGMTTFATTEITPVCVDEMGMKNGNISDDQLSFSSSYDSSSRPSSVRLGTVQVSTEPGAWVAGDLNTEQYVQVDFYEPRTLTGIITQGRDLVPQWVTAFYVTYSHDGITWNHVLNHKGELKVFPGNFDSYTPVTTYFPQPIRSRFFRINPISWNNWISMRFEVLGCFEPYEVTHSESVLNYFVTTSLPPFMKGICEDSMGFENYLLPDELITVSSTALAWSGASRIRLNQHADSYGTGGWVPSASERFPFVLVDFYGERNITGIITQGREDADMWVLSYTVQYSLDNVTWIFCRDLVKDSYIFPGNKDRNTPDVRLFDHIVTTRFVKVTIKTFYMKPSLRIEIIGCFKPYVIEKPETTTDQCVSFGPWLSHSDAVLEGDEEPIDQLIAHSDMCTNPIAIECREIITKQNYLRLGQNVICDLSRGFSCKNEHQIHGHCFNYEARIGCWQCEVPTEPTTTHLPLVVCPETPDHLIAYCPEYCPHDYACDGRTCIPHTDCPCFAEGKTFKVGNIQVTSQCEFCNCILGGHSKCEPIKCPPCDKNQVSEMNVTCDCICRKCAEGSVLCETNGQCIRENLWCDGTVDCPNDEINCPTTGPAITFKPKPIEPIVCTLDTESETNFCEMNLNSFTTFDDSHYQYDICDHVLMKEEVDERYFVTVHKDCDEHHKSNCHRFIIVYVDNMVLQMGPGPEELILNGYNVPVRNLGLLSKRYKDFMLRKRGNQIIFRSFKYDFEVQWDKKQDVKITVSKCKIHQLVGLCGFYNEVPSDDFLKPDGSYASGGQDFGNSWSIGDLNRCEMTRCSADVLSSASTVCMKLYEVPFNTCSSHMDLNTQNDICMTLMCECLQSISSESALEICKCQAYEAFAEECEAAIGVTLRDWRIKHDCTADCPSELEYRECGPGCDLTCDNYHESDTMCEDKCVPGCYCPPGLIHHNNQCIKQKMCQDCVCRGHGDPNYITFDNQYFSFQGNCTYILAQHQSGNENLDFQVLGVNHECPEEPHTSCTSGIKVLWHGHVIEKFQYEPVVIDGVQLSDANGILEKYGFTITSISKKSTIIHVKDINLAVRYFDQMFAFNIELPAYHYFNRTEGLCGICNFDKRDDLYHRDGYVTDDIDDFAYSWLVDNRRDRCVLPRVVVPSPPPGICNFTANSCDMFIDPTLYAKSCQNDISYSHNPDASMCRSKFQYAQQCCEKGVDLKEWLIESGCETSCPENMVFECTSACPKTCENYEQSQSDVCDLMPLYTCTCPSGQVLKKGFCVDSSSCKTRVHVCVYNHKYDIINGLQVPLSENNLYEVAYELGAQWKDGLCQNCSCIEKEGNPTTNCLVEHCPKPEDYPDSDIYVRQEKEILLNECCPRYKRTHCIGSGNVFNIGEEWPSPDGDNCRSFRCTLHTSGEANILERNIICDRKCPLYAEYVEPLPESGKCCGHCKPIACEEDGTIYQNGAKWKSTFKPCFSAECSVKGNSTSITYTGKSCDALPPNCPQEHIIPDANGCCFSCNVRTDQCVPVQIDPSETVRHFTFVDNDHGMCMNLNPILNLTKCLGRCESPITYLPSVDNFDSTCRCCQPLTTNQKVISLSCSDGSQLQKMYHQPIACGCSSCSRGVDNIDLPIPV